MGIQLYREPLITSLEDGAAVTAAAATSLLPSGAKKELPANFFQVGKQLLIKATGKISNVVTTPGTARFSVRLGATVVFDGLAVPLNIVAKTDRHWDLEILLTCRKIGSAAELMGSGRFTSESIIGSPAAASGAPGSMLLPYNAAPAVGNTFDSTASQVLDLYFTQTVATGSITLNQFLLDSVN